MTNLKNELFINPKVIPAYNSTLVHKTTDAQRDATATPDNHSSWLGSK
jgi:hypothetical protein